MTETSPVVRGEAGGPRTALAVRWAGYLLSGLPVLMLLVSATMKFLQPAAMQDQLGKLGWASEKMVALGVVELVSTVLYVIPQTSVLGAILLTGYLGGATATHVRVGDSFLVPVVLGVMLWAGLLVREPRLAALLPLRR
jgi:hypothetical protein